MQRFCKVPAPLTPQCARTAARDAWRCSKQSSSDAVFTGLVLQLRARLSHQHLLVLVLLLQPEVCMVELRLAECRFLSAQ